MADASLVSTVRTIAVLGAGTMGHGIAHAAITGGFETFLYDVDAAAVDKGMSAVNRILRKAVDLGKLPAGEVEAISSRVTGTTDLAPALAHADLVIEAAPE